MKHADLFAGTGAYRIALQSLDVNTVFSSEIDKFARQTIEGNFNEIPHGDITQIDPRSIPHFDLLTASPPCQPFSQAAMPIKQAIGFNDPRGTLFFNMATIIAYHRPKAIIMENVATLKTHDKGNTFRTILETFNQLDYQTFHKVLNARQFGLPQNRKRLFIVAFPFNDPFPIPFTFPIPTHTETSLSSVLESNPDPKHTLSDTLWKSRQAHKQRHQAKGNGFGYQLFNRDSPYAATLTARYPELLLVEQPGQNPRRFTPREYARLQGFPDSFKITVSDAQAYKQFGNAIAIPIVRAIAKQITRTLTREYA